MGASLVAQLVKNPPAMQKPRFLGQENQQVEIGPILQVGSVWVLTFYSCVLGAPFMLVWPPELGGDGPVQDPPNGECRASWILKLWSGSFHYRPHPTLPRL